VTSREKLSGKDGMRQDGHCHRFCGAPTHGDRRVTLKDYALRRPRTLCNAS
jgi:hypothetical protein